MLLSVLFIPLFFLGCTKKEEASTPPPEQKTEAPKAVADAGAPPPALAPASPEAPAPADSGPVDLTIALGVKESDTAKTASGLRFKDLKEGTGPSPKQGAKVTVHYTGWLMDGKKFDSSRDRSDPFTFVIGVGQVIKGWDEGVMTMKTGGHRVLIIPANLAYGEAGAPGAIPANATLRFEVQLLKAE